MSSWAISDLDKLLQEEIAQLLTQNNSGEQSEAFVPEGVKPYVIMVVGVNGVGKTTTIGKLAHHFSQAGKKVILGAADTFRAAAVDQLLLWGERTKVPVVSHGMYKDPGAVDQAGFAVPSGESSRHSVGAARGWRQCMTITRRTILRVALCCGANRPRPEFFR